MAIRKRNGRKSPWQVYWNNPFTCKRECANFETEAEARKYDSLVKHRLKFERESFRQEEEKENQDITLEMAYIMYLKEKQFSKKSLAWHLEAMRPALKKFGQLPAEKLNRNIFESVLQDLKNNPALKAATIHNRAAVFKTVLRWIADKNFCNPIQFPKLPELNYERFIPPTPAEINEMLQVAPEHLQRIILIGSQCGVRIGQSELFQLVWSDIDFVRSVLTVHGSQKNKNALWREVPIRQSLLPVLKKWHEKDQQAGIIYIINFQGKQVGSIKNAWKTMLKNAGIERKIRPYDLRHCFATELIAAGTDIGTVAKLMGHSSPVMILNHYQFVMDKQKRSAVESLPEIEYVPKICAQSKKGLQKNL